MRHLYSITRYPLAPPSRRAETPIEDLEAQEARRMETAWYLGDDELAAQIEARLDALYELRLTYRDA